MRAAGEEPAAVEHGDAVGMARRRDALCDDDLGEVMPLAAGDYVRWCKQTIDLLDQLSLVADPPVAVTARTALDAVRRGIVAYGSL